MYNTTNTVIFPTDLSISVVKCTHISPTVGIIIFYITHMLYIILCLRNISSTQNILSTRLHQGHVIILYTCPYTYVYSILYINI